MTQDVKEKAAAMHEATDIGTLIERVEAAKLPPRQRLVLSKLGSMSRSEKDIAEMAGIRTTWPAETARKHLMALRKGGLAREIKVKFGRSVWQSTEAGSALLRSLQSEETSNG
ncbi:hypothetical protein [Antarcticirhabdus aurantiaca]|uniref:Uncharacterized protein n=1 Tax=Antarcticirhabdus aurantiaca TaxID=2606717 RepID=A0ACD4NKF9_9HYPH|nr:hypothetical protein [Antarcticirhabdus aurantiaca]WAJ27121.1 hypothetical protein OXU80_20025 [Jeongeuplla avenae]